MNAKIKILKINIYREIRRKESKERETIKREYEWERECDERE